MGNDYREYQRYLYHTLDRIFNDKNGIEYSNDIRFEDKDLSDNSNYLYTDSEFNKTDQEYHEGVVWKKTGPYYNREFALMDENGNELFKLNGVRVAGSFHEGLAWVIFVDGEVRIVDKKGDTVFTVGKVRDISDFHNGYAVISKNGRRYALINRQGLISNIAFDDIKGFRNGFSIVRRGPFYNVIDTNLKVVGNWQPTIPRIHISHNFNFIGNKMISREDYLKDYNVKKTIFGYQCSSKLNKDKKINVSYKPLKVYYDKYVLCLDNKKVLYFYDKDSNTYTKIDNVKWVEFDDNFIVGRPHFLGGERNCFVVYFIYDGGIVDITDYYNSYLNGR